MCIKTDKFICTTASQFESPVIFQGAFNITENPVHISLTINYDDNTYYLLRIIRRTVIERRQNLCTLAVAVCACDWVRVRAALSLVESYNPAVMHVVDTIFITSVSNS